MSNPVASLTTMLYYSDRLPRNVNLERSQKMEREHKELLEEKRIQASDDGLVADDGEDQQLLSKLLSQVESLKEDRTRNLPEPPMETTNPSSSSSVAETSGKTEVQSKEIGTEEIVKELRKLKRQNTITHCLLSVMIFVTVVWQLSEVSLILNVKHKLSHPFKSAGTMIASALKGSCDNDQKGLLDNGDKKETEALRLPPLNIPELPILGLDDDDELKL
ncbi:hypothetical protein Sjap_019885 [Stephania japonica]|uniref:Uncharacterized protein n=1 Tax=Stephania japonica TaxID=461633 RepID=A0AAP0HZS4_9MAGN